MSHVEQSELIQPIGCDRKIGPFPCCSVVQGDCLELMKQLPDGCVDAVITDPPYGVAIAEWDDMDPREFARFTMGWLACLPKVATEAVIFSPSYRGTALKSLCEMIYPRVRPMVWAKPGGRSAERNLWFAHEMILHCYTPETNTYVEAKSLRVGELIRRYREAAGMSRGAVDIALRGKKTGLCFRWEEGACLPTPEQSCQLVKLLNMNGEYSGAIEEAYRDRDNVIARAREGASERAAELLDVFSYAAESDTGHPCQKPLDLLRDIITALIPSGLILDPFCGSGTTLVAAKKLGRHFLGFEISPEYCEIARKRLDAIDRQPSLFQPKPEQLGLEAQ